MNLPKDIFISSNIAFSHSNRLVAFYAKNGIFCFPAIFDIYENSLTPIDTSYGVIPFYKTITQNFKEGIDYSKLRVIGNQSFECDFPNIVWSPDDRYIYIEDGVLFDTFSKSAIDISQHIINLAKNGVIIDINSTGYGSGGKKPVWLNEYLLEINFRKNEFLRLPDDKPIVFDIKNNKIYRPY